MWKILFSLYFYLLCNIVQAETITTFVSAGNKRSCKVYLRLPENAKNLKIVLFLNGTGIYSNGDDAAIPVPANYLFSELNNFALLTLDKPGIDSIDGKITIDHNIYNQYLQEDLVTCTQRALEWAEKQTAISNNAPIFLLGHSEGSQVLARAYIEMLKQSSDQALRVKMLMLDGLPLNSWASSVPLQFPENKRELFLDAIKNNDDKWLMKNAGGVSAAYYQDIFKTKPLAQELIEIINMNSTAKFQIYQGLQDTNIKPETLQQLDYQNQNWENNNHPSLKMDVRYYMADHELNVAAINDMIFTLMAYLRD